MTPEIEAPQQTILVIEDEENIVRLVTLFLEGAGYRVISARDGAAGIEMHTREHPDLIILDLMLPKVDGRDVLKQIRTWSSTPVLVLTALGDEQNRVERLDDGADDFVSKPFSSRELVSRVRAILRRVSPKYIPPESEEKLAYAGLTIYPAIYRTEVNDKPVDLTAKEFLLLLTLASNPDHVFTREALLNRVWGFDYLGDSRTVDVHVGTLRKKIEHDPTRPRFVKTIYRVGYKFDSRGLTDAEEGQDEALADA